MAGSLLDQMHRDLYTACNRTRQIYCVQVKCVLTKYGGRHPLVVVYRNRVSGSFRIVFDDRRGSAFKNEKKIIVLSNVRRRERLSRKRFWPCTRRDRMVLFLNHRSPLDVTTDATLSSRNGNTKR